MEKQTIPNQSTAVLDLSAVDVEQDIADLPTQKGHLRKTHNTVQHAVAPRVRRAIVQIPETIPEEPAQIPEPQLQELEPQVAEPQPMEKQTIPNQSTAVLDLSAVDVEQDIADLPTQKRHLRKIHNTVQKNNPRRGYRTVREGQSLNFVPPEQEIEEKENILDNWKTIAARTEEQPIIPSIVIQRASDPEQVLTSMLQEAGLVDLQTTRPEQPPVEVEVEEPPHKRRRCGSASSESMPGSLDRTEVSLGDSDYTTDSERIIRNWKTIAARTEEQPIIPSIVIQRASDPEQVLTSMLQETGLVDLQTTRPEQPPVEVEVEEPPHKRRRCGSASSESMPGSLDRTEVSLGDSDYTTDSERIIRDQWGAVGVMVKILKMVKAGTRPRNMDSLMSFGPIVPGSKRIIAARCFTSILKLKEHGFVKLHKDPHTLKILDISLGPKFGTC